MCRNLQETEITVHKSVFKNKYSTDSLLRGEITFRRFLNRLLCAAAALTVAVAVSSCSFSDVLYGALSGSESSGSTVVSPRADSSFGHKGQPSVQTEMITGSVSESSSSDDSDADAVLPAAADYFLKDADEKIRQCYLEIYAGLIGYNENIDITDGVIPSDLLDDLMTLIICTSPEMNQIGSSYSIVVDNDNYVRSLNVSYVKNQEEGGSQLAQLRSEAESICLQAEGLDDYEKLKYFHDRIILKCAYSDETENAYSAYGCLIEGKAVCEGYSKAMQILCERAGILCIPVLGESLDADGEGVPHMWNMVYLNGGWYNIDATWDDPISDLGNDYIRYDYFNISDEICSRDHIAEESVFMKYPQAASDEENYYVKSGLVVYDAASAYGVFESAAVKAIESHDRYVRVKCSSDEVYDWVYSEIFGGGSGNGSIFDILKSASEKTSPDISYASYSLIRNENTNTYTVILNQE
ncbi:transglutaminase domain-containing protein [Ruminococcus sp. Marseille-P6503]|uniref:transglutaminase domain-containing protein n=1 Tax=Ruminococcus sp. Marseille-P6503 TaxID=2364796 RepID=UPI000F5487D5|nr:transglutaminase domain-containing protein [Ruminococcus sp. Marseille-P6503]